jgi:hypothetical protein
MLWQFEVEFGRVRTIFKIWHRKPMDSENKIAVIIRITAKVEKSCGLDEHSARGVEHPKEERRPEEA